MFDRGVTVFRVWGIPVRLHFTLLLFMPYLAFVAARQFEYLAASLEIPPGAIRLPAIAWGILLAVGLFVSVLLHELAHVAVARRAGTRVRSITLMMLGGVTALEGEVVPQREAWMALAGPLASLGIAAACWALTRILPLPPEVAVATLALGWTNLVLGLFNLLPAFPMDGGRVLRGLLVPRVGASRATRIATSLGRWLAAALAILGLATFNVLLILIAAFVYAGASAERTGSDARDVLRGLPVARFMTGRLGEARPEESTGDVARRLLLDDLAGARVVAERSDGELRPRTIGIVTAEELADRAAHGAGALPVESAVHTDLPTVHRQDDASRTLDVLGRGTAAAVVVLDEADEIVGLVTEEDVRRALALAAIRPSRSMGASG